MRPTTLAETHERIMRYLERAWHTCSIDSPGIREYLTFSSPAEFASRNVFIEQRPPRRARSGFKPS